MLGLTCLWPEYTHEVTGADEVYAVTGQQLPDGFMRFGIYPPASVNNDQTRFWKDAHPCEVVLPRGFTSRGAVVLREDDGEGDWDKSDQMLRFITENSNSHIPKVWAKPLEVKDYQITAHVAVAASQATSGKVVQHTFTRLDNDDQLGEYFITVPATGMAAETREFLCIKDKATYGTARGDWRYKVRYLITREPCNADGSPIAATPPNVGSSGGATNPDATGGGDFTPLGNAFAVRLDGVDYGAKGVGTPNEVAVELTFKNQLRTARVVTFDTFRVHLQGRQGMTHTTTAANVTGLPKGTVPASGEVEVRYRYTVGDQPRQKDLVAVSVAELSGTGIKVPSLPGRPAQGYGEAKWINLPPYEPKKEAPPAYEPGQGQIDGLAKYAGKYKTNRGTIVTITVEGKVLKGVAKGAGLGGGEREEFTLELAGADGALAGTWRERRGPSDTTWADLGIKFSDDANSFTGGGKRKFASYDADFPYSGTRINSGGGNASVGGDFIDIGRGVLVRVDSVKRGRANSVEAVLSVRKGPEAAGRIGINTNLLDAFLKDAAGTNYPSDGNLYPAEGVGTPAALGRTVWLEREEDTSRVRFFFDGVPASVTALKSLFVLNRNVGGEPVEYDLSGVQLGGEVVGGGDGFIAFKRYDVKIDALRRGADGNWQADLTVRNAAAEGGSRLGLTASEFTLLLYDADGISHKNTGNLYLVSPTPSKAEPEPIRNTVWMEPQETARMRLWLPGSKSLTAPVKLRLTENYGPSRTFPVTPDGRVEN